MFHAEMRTDGQADKDTDRRTDMTNLIVNFRNFEKAPKNQYTLTRNYKWLL
jgi:hypothetical protein